MKAFSYVDARSEKDALASLGTERNRILAIGGGMDLLGLMKDYIVTPERLVNVKTLDATIARTPDGGMRIGSAVKLIDIVEHAGTGQMYPALVELADQIGTPQIRHAGTVGGNLNQRPRCWYFRNEEFHCLKKGGATCFSVNGENQFHAIFGDGPCHIVHPSSLAVACVAYGATFRIAGPSGVRDVDAGQYFQMPDHNLYGENVLQPNELLTHVTLPAPGQVKSASYEVRFKQAHDWPLAFASVVLAMQGDTIHSARVVMGAVAPVPWRSHEAEQALAGRTISEETADRAGQAAVRPAKPMSGNAYKMRVARTAVARAILKAGGLKTA